MFESLGGHKVILIYASIQPLSRPSGVLIREPPVPFSDRYYDTLAWGLAAACKE
jgi:hypothetical protein